MPDTASLSMTVPDVQVLSPGLWSLWLLVAVVQDTRQRLVSNRLVLVGALGALALALAPGGLGLASALQGGAIALLVFLPGWVLRQLGAGDVKLAAVCGLLVGADAVWGLCLAILLAGGLQALLWLGARWLKRLPRWWVRSPMQLPPSRTASGPLRSSDGAAMSRAASRLPYAWAVAAGSAVHWLGWP